MNNALSIIHSAIAHRYLFRAVPEITEDTLLADIADSLDCVTIALAVEEVIGRELPEAVTARWVTVGDVAAVLARNIDQVTV